MEAKSSGTARKTPSPNAEKKQHKLIGLQNLYSPSEIIPNCKLPQRFKKEGQIKNKSARKQHPMYRTTTNDYGSRAPAQEELPEKYYGTSHHFTNQFGGGMFTDEGLVTSMSTRKLNE